VRHARKIVIPGTILMFAAHETARGVCIGMGFYLTFKLVGLV
jgi:hypothetical protein